MNERTGEISSDPGVVARWREAGDPVTELGTLEQIEQLKDDAEKLLSQWGKMQARAPHTADVAVAAGFNIEKDSSHRSRVVAAVNYLLSKKALVPSSKPGRYLLPEKATSKWRMGSPGVSVP